MPNNVPSFEFTFFKEKESFGLFSLEKSVCVCAQKLGPSKNNFVNKFGPN